jgi:hypothetical protein
MSEEIRIGARTYHKVEHGVFVIPLHELDTLSFNDVPYYSQLEVRPLPFEPSFFDMTVTALHAGGPHNEEFSLSIKVSYTLTGQGTDPLVIAKYKRTRDYARRVLQPIAQDHGFEFGPDWTPFLQAEDRIYCMEACYRHYTRAENPVIAHAIAPFLAQYPLLARFRDTLVFICHASEDKPFVDKLCCLLDEANIPIWYDRREIRVGDSIVQRISEGLGQASHLAIVLSRTSTSKPWVMKEISAGLVRQLSEASIRVLPIVIDTCTIPPILADVRYANCRSNLSEGVRELLEAIA